MEQLSAGKPPRAGKRSGESKYVWGFKFQDVFHQRENDNGQPVILLFIVISLTVYGLQSPSHDIRHQPTRTCTARVLHKFRLGHPNLYQVTNPSTYPELFLYPMASHILNKKDCNGAASYSYCRALQRILVAVLCSSSKPAASSNLMSAGSRNTSKNY